eukprot:298929-Lingulodinium_polyedra.AAC.1
MSACTARASTEALLALPRFEGFSPLVPVAEATGSLDGASRLGRFGREGAGNAGGCVPIVEATGSEAPATLEAPPLFLASSPSM